MARLNIDDKTDKFIFQYPDKTPKTIMWGSIIIKEVTPKKEGMIHLPEGTQVKITHYIEDFVEEDLDERLKGKIKKGDKVVVKIYGDEAVVAKRKTEDNELVFFMVDQGRILGIY